MNFPSLRRFAPVATAALLAGACLTVYVNSFRAPFLFDDEGSIGHNPTLHSILRALVPPMASSVTVAGRPVLNVSFALNYALSGTAVWSYHTLNLLIHIAAACTLFAILRQTLALLRPHDRRDMAGLAGVSALLWAVHPLNTEAVTYVAQRAESLVSLWYLLTLYAFIRGATSSSRATVWYVGSAVCCALGMATKEVMVSAPLAVLLYDRTFVTGSFAGAWRRRRFYSSLAATWLVLAALVAATHGRGGSAGFHANVGSWSYALTQARALLRYLRLVVWPHPLVFDYGTAVAARWQLAALPSGVLVLLAIGTAAAVWRRHPVGFAGFVYFALLAPSSSFVPVATQTMAEHRMYLAGAVVVSSVVVGAYGLLGRRSLLVWLIVAIGFGGVTLRRNRDYRTEENIWRDTVAKCPGNARAHATLALCYYKQARYAAAIAEDHAALRLDPAYQQARSNLGAALQENGQLAEAVGEFRRVLATEPDAAEVHCNLGHALAQLNDLPGALAEFRWAVRLRPDSAEIHARFGDVLCQAGQWNDAASQYDAARRCGDDDVLTLQNLGTALLRQGRCAAAIACYDRALATAPNLAPARMNLGVALEAAGRWPEAVNQLAMAVRLDPANAEAFEKLGIALVRVGRVPDARQCLAASLRLRPDAAVARELEALRRP